jgi:DNA-binding transcriptional MerR regulator
LRTAQERPRRPISEVAADLDLPQHVLRFWETRFTQIKPMKRGGGRRYYRPEDINLLRGIRRLLYGEGYTIRGVQRLLKEKGATFVSAFGEGSEHALPAAELLADEEAVSPAEAPSSKRLAGEAALARAAPRTNAVPGEVGAPLPTPPKAPPAFALSSRRRIEGILSDLIEAKRLLDQVR